MTRSHSLLTGLVVAGAAGVLSLPALGDPPAKSSPSTLSASKQRALIRQIGRTPLSFESNQGQTDAKVRFLAHTADSTLFLTPSEAVFSMTNIPDHSPGALKSSQKNRKAARNAQKIAHVALRMQMVGANPKAGSLARQPLAGKVNYLVGQDRSRWHTDVPTFGKVGFENVYRGVDLVYYGNQQHLEYDFVVAPHADPKQIQLHFAGADGIHLNRDGTLVVRTGGRELRWQKPTVYQEDASGRQAVSARFQLKRLPDGKTGVSFALGRYDHARSLVIDPVLLYSTYLGGTDGYGSYYPNAIAVDSGGNVYVAGSTFSADFPVTAGAYQAVKHSSQSRTDIFVTKLNPTGTGLVYSTYLGGSEDSGAQADAIAVDSSGNAYLTGSTALNGLPTTAGAFQTASVNGSAFVTKINPSGTALVYSTYLGGSRDDWGYGIAVDANGSAYVTGMTVSADFPTTPGAFQPTFHAHQGHTPTNGFVTKLNPAGTALVYSTYLGGSTFDYADAIAVDSSGAAYVTGLSVSLDFPTTAGAFQTVQHGSGHLGTDTFSSNAFVTKLNPSGSALLYSTYLGGSYNDWGIAIAIDGHGSAYVAGNVTSVDFPVTSGAFKTSVTGTGFDGSNAFVAKVNPTGSALLYSTLVGGSVSDRVGGIAIDSAGDAYLTGYTSSRDFPTTPGAFQTRGKGSSAFVTELNPTGSALLYSTYLSGSGGFYGAEIAVDGSGAVYVAGSTNSVDFPTTSHAFQRTKPGPTEFTISNFITKLAPINVLPDFDGDGHTDLLLQNVSTNTIATWFQNGPVWSGGAYFSLTPPAEYALVGVGDFGKNSPLTLVLQSKITGQIALWYTGGVGSATIAGGDYVDQIPQAGWKVVGVGDFNKDGKSDLVLQNQTTRQVALWFLDGAHFTDGVQIPYTPPAGWSVVGAGDFNHDGFTDIAFQNQTTGQIALWFMHGSNYSDGTILQAKPTTGWSVVGAGDYNGDGYADLILQNKTSRQGMIWYLINGIFSRQNTLSLTPPAGWKIVGPR